MKYCEAQKKDCWLLDRQSFFTLSAVIFYASILVNQFFKVRRGGVGAVQLWFFCYILSQIVEVDVIPVYIHYRAHGAASGLIDLQEIIRVVGKQGEILIQGLGVLQHLAKAFNALRLLGGTGVQVEQLGLVAIALQQVQRLASGREQPAHKAKLAAASRAHRTFFIGISFPGPFSLIVPSFRGIVKL